MQTTHAPVLATAALLGSCSVMYGDDADSRQCKTTPDCEAAGAAIGALLVCSNGVCERPGCTAASECPANASCVDRVCVQNDAGALMVPRPCTQDGECGGTSRCGFDGFCYEKWGCLDQDRDWTPADPNVDFRATVRRFEDISNAALVGDLKVAACTSSNPACNPPVVPNDAVQLTSDKVLTVPFRGLAQSGFVGSVDVTPRASADAGVSDAGGVIPAYYHFTSESPLVTNLTAQTELLLADLAVFPLLARSWNVQLDLTRATVVLQAHDCGGRKAADVSLTPSGVSDYLFVPVTGKSTPTLGPTATTEDGAALLLNVPAERSLVYTLRDDVQGRVLSDKITFTTRGKALNYLAYYPRRSAVARWMAHAKAQGLTP